MRDIAPRYAIVTARPRDLPLLPAIELAAARMLAAWLEEEALAETTNIEQLADAQRDGRLWVALDDERPVGFAYAKRLEPAFAHLEEIDVHPDHGHRGIGRRLLTTVSTWAANRAYRGVTLTTFRDPPWNMPFYASAGFELVSPTEMRPALAALFERESARGLDSARRVVMEQRNSAQTK
ncbi:MAG TPA: GNAT family N-acetyltransferase [Gemmatimonadaceae bacterium]|nr:GNAT family N-acetyltransferase [Gemmatimonadaceae bacterium]